MPMFHPWYKQRSGRLEYFTTLLGIWAVVPCAILFTFGAMGGITGGSTSTPDGVWVVYYLAAISANFYAVVRRFHDMEKSGWKFIWLAIPLVGWYFHLVLLGEEGTQGLNKYGSMPPKRILWFPVGRRAEDEVVPQCPID